MSEETQNSTNWKDKIVISYSSLYQKYVVQPLTQLDSGNIIHMGFINILRLGGIAIGLFMLYLLISGLFGPTGYFSSITNFETFIKVRSYILFFITFLIAAGLIFVILGIIWKRISDLKNSEFNGIIHFISFKFIPWIPRTIAEVFAILILYIGLIDFLSFLFLAIPYFPIGSYTGSMISAVPAGSYLIQNYVQLSGLIGVSDYFSLLLISGILPLMISIFISFFIIVIFYLLSELYLLILNWLLHFGIPIRFRNPLEIHNSNN